MDSEGAKEKNEFKGRKGVDVSKNKSSPASGLNGILINMGESLNGLLDNGVNGTGTFSEGTSSGRCPVGEQCRPGRHPATARIMWSKDDNKVVMEPRPVAHLVEHRVVVS